MTKKLESLLFALLFVVFALTSCNSNTNNSDKEIVRIGAILPLTGNASDVGANAKQGIEILLDNYSSENYEFELDAYDSKSKPSLGKTLMYKMLSKNNKKPLIVYSQISGVTLNVQSETEKNKIILIGCVGTDKLIKEDTRYTYRGFISPNIVGKEIASYVANNLIEESIGIFYINNTFGDTYKRHVIDHSKKLGIDIVFSEPYSPELRNYRDLISKSEVANKNLNAVYLAGVGKSIGLFIKQLRENGYNGIILGDANLPNQSAMNVAGQFMENVVYLDFKIPDDIKNSNFYIDYRRKFGENPDNFSYIAYDGINHFIDFINQTGITDPDIIKDSITQYKSKGVLGKITISNNEINFPLSFNKVSN